MQLSLETLARQHLTELAVHIGTRPTGSPGNHKAAAYIQSVFTRTGWQVEMQPFDCLNWESGSASLICDGQPLALQVNPFSPSFSGQYPVVRWASLDEAFDFEPGQLKGHMLMLDGVLAQDPYMPKNFPFFQSAEQLDVINHIETAQPEAVLCVYTSPLFCDADFHIPSVTISREVAQAVCNAKQVSLTIQSKTVPSTGSNVVARLGTGAKKIVICAHFDTWFNTPGALDNGTGVTTLLALAETYKPRDKRVEIVAFNGEDYYAAPGEVTYLAGQIDDIDYVINIDGVGAMGKQISLSFHGDYPALFEAARAVKANLVEVEPWPQGDHMIFAMRGIPALALSSANAFDLWNTLTHTPSDTIEGIELSSIVETVEFIQKLLSN